MYGPRYDKPVLDESGNLLTELINSGILTSLLQPHKLNVDENECCESENQALFSDCQHYYFNQFENLENEYDFVVLAAPASQDENQLNANAISNRLGPNIASLDPLNSCFK